jgi:hypothetical protein
MVRGGAERREQLEWTEGFSEKRGGASEAVVGMSGLALGI